MSSDDQAETALAEAVENERLRITRAYRRRAESIPRDTYAAWRPEVQLAVAERRRVAEILLHGHGAFPQRGDRCLEIGCGTLGWLATLLDWGLACDDLAGIELDAARAGIARAAFPAADLRVGDATSLPWPDGSFRLTVASTVFTSILDDRVRRIVAGEIVRVLAPGGALLWYDFAYNNPRNPNVRAVGRSALLALFPGLELETRWVTLAPPIARAVAPRSRILAHLLCAIRPLRTHLLGVLVRTKGGA